MSVNNIGIKGSTLPLSLHGGVAHVVSIRSHPESDNGYSIRLKGDLKGFKEIQIIKARLNELADSIRKTHDVKITEDRDEITEKIKADLRGINKFFPPYPPGSEERVRLLKSYVAFRLLIEKLTIPPEVIDMMDEEASEKSTSIKSNIEEQDKGISVNTDNIQHLF